MIIMAVFRAPRTLAGRTTTSKGRGARCTPRPSPPPSLACPSARLQSKDDLYSRAQLNFFFRLCFVKLKLLLLALEVRPDDGGDTKISINPRGSKIPANTVGFFIAGDCMEVRTIDKYISRFTSTP